MEDKEMEREKEAKKSKKGMEENEDNHEEVMKESKGGMDENEDEEHKPKKAKKSKQGMEEDHKETKKEKELNSKLAQLTKIANTPIIAAYLKARKMIGDDEDKLNETKTAMLKASVEDNQLRLDEIKPFLAHLEFNAEAEVAESAETKFPYGLGGEQFSGATEKSGEELYDEVYNQ